MEQHFDSFNRYEIPTLTLANPSLRQLHTISEPKNYRAVLRFNAVSEMNFYVDDTPECHHFFDLLIKDRLIHQENFGWFRILDTELVSSGTTPRKQISCMSFDSFLTFKQTNLAAGTYILYNPAEPEGTLLYELLKDSLTWKLGYVNPTFYSMARTFEMPDTNIFAFLTDDVAKAYECLVLFDNEKMTINICTAEETVLDSGVPFRYDTIMKEIRIRDTQDKPVTAVSCYGAGEFSIRSVNPLGTPTIYNFEYVKDMMSPELWEAVQAWQAKIDAATQEYADILTALKTSNSELLTLKSDLAKIEFILESGKQVRDAWQTYTLAFSSNQATTAWKAAINATSIESLRATILAATAYPAFPLASPYLEQVTLNDRGIVPAIVNIYACEKVVVAQNSAITAKEAQIADLESTRMSQSDALSIPNNFTLEQRTELEKFIFGVDYTNEYVVITDLMTYPEIQEIGLELMKQGKSYLDRVAQPTFEFELDAVNYMFNPEYEGLIRSTKLGQTIYAEISEDDWVTPLLLEIDINWTEPDEFKMIFGNRFRLQSAQFTWKDINDEVAKVSSTISSELSDLIAPQRDGTISWIRNLIDNGLDAAKNHILAGKDQNMVLDEHGLLGRMALRDPNGNLTGYYSDEQLKILNNLLVFTSDNWQNCRLALGKINLGTEDAPNWVYGLIADAIIGKLLAGETLVITNDNGDPNLQNKFVFDGNGARLENASMVFTSTNGKMKIIINPTEGIKIQAPNASTGAIEDKFYVDGDGNLVIKGIITAEQGGKIGNWTIQPVLEGGGLSYNGNAIYLGVPGIAARILNANRNNIVFKAGENFGVDINGYLFARKAYFTEIESATGNIEANSLTAAYLKAIEIDASRITSGTIDAARINVGALKVKELDGAYGTFTYLTGTQYIRLGVNEYGQTSAEITPGSISFGSGLVTIRPNEIQMGNGTFSISYNQYSGTTITLGLITITNAGIRLNGSQDQVRFWMNPPTGSGPSAIWVQRDGAYSLGISTSKRSAKKDFADIGEECVRILDRLKPVYFRYMNQEADTPRLVGFIAEEVSEVCQEITAYDSDGTPSSVQYPNVTALLTADAQITHKRLDDQDKRIYTLSRKNTKLQKENVELKRTSADQQSQINTLSSMVDSMRSEIDELKKMYERLVVSN